MEIFDNELHIVFVGAADELKKMGGIRRVFPNISLNLRSTGFLVHETEIEINQRYIVLALDSGKYNVISMAEEYINDRMNLLTDVIVVKSIAYGFEDVDFYRRWENYEMPNNLKLFYDSKYDIDREHDFGNPIRFLHFSKGRSPLDCANEREEMNTAARIIFNCKNIIGSVYRKFKSYRKG